MADRAEALRARLLATFRLEADDHLRTIGAQLEALANQPSSGGAPLETVFRAMHTLKGAARSVGMTDFEAAAHRCEALLSAAIAAGGPLEERLVRTLLDAVLAFAGHLRGATTAAELAQVGVFTPAGADAQPEPEPAPPLVRAPVAEPPRAGIRVETERLDRLVLLAENLLSPKLAVAEHAARALAIVEEIRTIRTRHAALDELRALELRARELAVALRNDQRTLPATVDDIYEELLRIRLTPAATLLEGFPLMVRELCRVTGKDVAWQSSGEHLEIDRKVLALVKDPLVHMIRNAIDHGIEPPNERQAAGKPRRGRVSVTVAPAERGRISIEVADDGRGFAIEALREAAVRSRLSSADDVAAMSDDELTELAFNAGVSTSPMVTTISGHGRGLAIVRESIERIEGTITTRSTPGVGTVIRLELPASIVTYRALLVRVEDDRFLLPLDAIERAFPVTRSGIPQALAEGQLATGDERLPFATLRDVLGLVRRPSDADDQRRELPCILIRNGERRGVVLVDEVFGEHEVVIKELRPPLRRVRGVLAAGLLGTGDLVLVLRPLDVLLALRTARRAEAVVPAAARPARLLIVDDSITTRTMERSMFEAAGYTVQVAADGLEAWETLQSEAIDVVVSDVDMPRLDGFGLTERIRAHPSLGRLPVVLVSAQETRADEERGQRVGANAYVLKSGFDQTMLLEIVRRLA